MILKKRITAHATCASCGKPATGYQPIYQLTAMCHMQEPESMQLCKDCLKKLRQVAKEKG